MHRHDVATNRRPYHQALSTSIRETETLVLMNMTDNHFRVDVEHCTATLCNWRVPSFLRTSLSLQYRSCICGICECSWMGLYARFPQTPLPFIHRALILMPKKGKKKRKGSEVHQCNFIMLSSEHLTTQICSFYYLTKTVFLYRTIQRRVNVYKLDCTQRKNALTPNASCRFRWN